MQTKSYLCNFIKNHDNWKELLSVRPYFIKIKESYPFAIFNYNMLASESIIGENDEVIRYTCDFSLPEVQEARGIIINIETCDVVCWPFRKFGNYGESYVDDIDWSSAKVQEKVDGSILKLWFNEISNKWHVSSNSMIDADEARPFSDISLQQLFFEAANKQNLNFEILDKDFTYIFELVSPFNRVVIKYPETEIYHTGTRNNKTGIEYDVDIGIKKPKKYAINSISACIQAAKMLNDGYDEYNLVNEGFVVVDKNWHRIKVKSPKYVLIHHSLTGNVLSKRRIINIILENEEEEYLAYYPQYKEQFDIYGKKLSILQNEIVEAHKKFLKVWDDADHNKKKFAEIVSKEKRKGWAFSTVFGNTPDEIFTLNYIVNQEIEDGVFEKTVNHKLIEEIDKIEV